VALTAEFEMLAQLRVVAVVELHGAVSVCRQRRNAHLWSVDASWTTKCSHRVQQGHILWIERVWRRLFVQGIGPLVQQLVVVEK
jgi:hypothetical protein